MRCFRQPATTAPGGGWTAGLDGRGEIYRDEGISGTRGRDKRPGLDALLKGVARREFDIVAAWSVCRLGRSLSDLIGLLGELQARDIDLYLHQQALDTSTPSGRMPFGMLGVFSEFERAIPHIQGGASGCCHSGSVARRLSKIARQTADQWLVPTTNRLGGQTWQLAARLSADR